MPVAQKLSTIKLSISHSDRDAKYGLEVQVANRSLRMNPVRTCFESPSQNGVEERWVESSRRDLLDHIIALNERHLKRLLSE
jgi:putative transposase